jgi:hypothetical protein
VSRCKVFGQLPCYGVCAGRCARVLKQHSTHSFRTTTLQTPVTWRTGTTVAGNGAQSLPVPAGTVSGDLIIITAISNAAITTPTGFTLQGTVSPNFDTMSSFTKVSDGTEGANISVTSAGTAEFICDVIVGANNATPMDAAATTGNGTAATVTAPAITTVTNNAEHVFAMADRVTDAAFSTPAGYTARKVAAATNYSVKHVSKTITPAGSIGSVSANDGDATPHWGAISLAIRPA